MGYMEELRSLVGHRCVILNGSVTVLRDAAGRVLLQHRSDGRWGLPGGLMELGESCEETARRETKEETGLDPEGLTLLGVWSGKDCLCRVSNGDEFYAVTAAYLAESWSGTLREPDEESLGFAWAPLDALPENVPASHRRILDVVRESAGSVKEPVLCLTERTRALCHAFYRALEQDPALFRTPEEYEPYSYDAGQVDAIFDRQSTQPDRRCWTVLLGGRVIGDVTLKLMDPAARSCELGICLVSDRWKNRGFGSRAVRLALGLAFGVLGMETVTAKCLPGNARSRRALEKAGFVCVGEAGGFLRCEITAKRYGENNL